VSESNEGKIMGIVASCSMLMADVRCVSIGLGNLSKPLSASDKEQLRVVQDAVRRIDGLVVMLKDQISDVLKMD
jgi:hypothetical protein